MPSADTPMRVWRFVPSLLRNTLYAALALPLLAGPLRAQGQAYSVDQLIRLVQSRVFTEERILGVTEESCLAFRLDDKTEARLREAGASDELINGLRDACVSLPYGVESIRIDPQQLELPVGLVDELRVTALDADSNVVRNVPLEWSSSDTTIAAVFGDGIVVGKIPGEALITARIEGSLEGTMSLRIVERDSAAIAVKRSKSTTTAAALGVIPGGGEFYTGNTTKGAIVLLGSAAVLAAGFLISSEDTLPAVPLVSGSCEETSCLLQVKSVSEVQTTSFVVAGVVVAAALWAYGLVDGIRAASRSELVPAEPGASGDAGLSLEFLPRDGIRVSRAGDVDLTLLRVR